MTTQKHARITAMIGMGALALALGACGEQKTGPATTTEVVTQTDASSASQAGTGSEATSPADQGSEAKSSAPASAESSNASADSDSDQPSDGRSKDTSGEIPIRPCTSDQLTVTAGRPHPAAGSIMYVLTFNNKGDGCQMSGFPGIVAVGGGNGTQIGSAASWQDDQEKQTVTLASNGGRAQVKVKMTNIGTNGGPLGERCKAVPADGLRVYPPGSKKALFVKLDSMYACSAKVDWMRTGRVTVG